MPIFGEKHRFTRKNVELAPDAPGVYALFDDGKVAYYGRAQGGSDTIRRRLNEHLAGRQPPGRVKAKLFSFEVTHYPLSREQALLEEYRRRNWHLPEYNMLANGSIALGLAEPNGARWRARSEPTATAAEASFNGSEERKNTGSSHPGNGSTRPARAT
jgi:aryl-alcohol dehydrogenase-like predicted oxidoreductase